MRVELCWINVKKTSVLFVCRYVWEEVAECIVSVVVMYHYPLFPALCFNAAQFGCRFCGIQKVIKLFEYRENSIIFAFLNKMLTLYFVGPERIVSTEPL